VSVVAGLEHCIQQDWDELAVCGPRPRGIEYFAQATGVTKMVVFLFLDGRARPTLVAKVARDPSQNERLRAETETIARVRAQLPDDLAATLPGPIYLTHLAHQTVTIEPFLPGHHMDALIPSARPLRPAVARDVLGRALRWLVGVQREVGRLATPLDNASRVELLVTPIHAARQCSDLTHAEAAYLNELEEGACRAASRLPLYLYHGDFRLGNILVGDGRLHVLDWDFSRPLAAPLLDWFSFAFRLYSRSLALPDIDGPLPLYRQAFQAVFLADNRFSRCLAESTLEYCDQLGVPRSLVSLLLGLFVVDNINKFFNFLDARAQTDHLYLLRGSPLAEASFRAQLRRQAYVWFLSDLARTRVTMFS
jgi:Phosphotransferase enzyme family